MWVITRAINEYNQEGDYLVAVFEEKPSIIEITTLLECSESYATHLLSGGGRFDIEDDWYYLTELKHGQLYS